MVPLKSLPLTRSREKRVSVAAVTLGCPKNQVDTEQLLGRLTHKGLVYTEYPEQAEWLVINTCAFIQSAEAETVQTLLAAAKIKQKKKKQKLVVAGCLVKKYGAAKLKQLIPEIDLALLPNQLEHIEDWLDPLLPSGDPVRRGQLLTRTLLSPPGTAFLKIAEGCSRKCAFCLIPQLRGRLCSKPLHMLLTEAEQLVRSGCHELVLVAQDSTSYGRDLKSATSLPILLDHLVKLRSLKWLRLMYINPDGVTEGLIKRIQREKKICNYLDMPIQHASARVLRSMNRSGNGSKWLTLIKRIRTAIPEISLRTTLLTGFPGESEEDHCLLKSFIQTARFDRLGVFTYSKEPGTKAAELSDQIHYATKRRRQKELMAIQRLISQEQLKRHIGKTTTCLVEEQSGPRHVIARTCWDAPEIDGAIILKGMARPGQLVRAKVTGATIHDLYGELL